MCFRLSFTSCLMILILFLREIDSLTIAKSRITICENTDNDPINVVYNKKCEKKLVLVERVNSGQGETERLYVTVNKAYDEMEKEQARLYNPFIVTLSMSPMFLVYPIYYRATVNNKPIEEIKLKTESDDCYEDNVCARHLDQDGIEIFKSKGFCCRCINTKQGQVSGPRLHSFTFEDQEKNHFRGQIDCDTYRASLHCMTFDRLWYDVHDIGVFTFDFTIWVKAYDQVTREVGNQTFVDWVDGGQIELSPTKSGGVGKHGRIIAKYIGQFSSGREAPNLEGKFFMIPNTNRLKFDKRTHPQVKNGYADYLIFPNRYVLFNNSNECDIIGVSLQAFTQQSTIQSKTDYGCYQKQGTCLRNQIKDFFEADQLRRDRGEQTEFFPESYGKITGLKKRPGTTDRVVEFESEETHSVLVYLEISADDLLLIYNRATGVIVKAFAKQFEAQSRNGRATVIVQNTGFVTADFYITLEGCSSGIKTEGEKTASINPQTNHEFEFRLEAYEERGGSFFCNVMLYDARRTQVDTSVLTINTTGTCICILGCGCWCTDQKYACANQSDEVFEDENPLTYRGFDDMLIKTIGDVLTKIGGAFGIIASILGQFVGMMSYLPILFAIVAILILLCVGRLICQLIPTGVCVFFVKKAVKKAVISKKTENRPRPTVVVIRRESDSETGESDVEGNNVTGEDDNSEAMTTTKFLFEFFFFFILPFVLIYEIAKLAWTRFIFSNTFRWINENVTSCTDMKEEHSGDEDSDSYVDDGSDQEKECINYEGEASEESDNTIIKNDEL